MAHTTYLSFLLLSGFCFSLAIAFILPPFPLNMTTTITSNLNRSKSNRTSALVSGFSAPAAHVTVIPSLALNEEYICYTSSPYVHRPSYSDCVGAILQLPNDNVLRKFYSGRAGPEASRLPFERRHGSCRIVIDLKLDAREDQETWLTIWNRAAQLNVDCVYPARLDEYYGGFTEVGQQEEIVISLTFATDIPHAGERGSVAVAS